jgi:hypothetical protein
MEKLLEKDAPLVTLVNIIGALDAKPMSTYTKNNKEYITLLHCHTSK